MCSLTDRPTDKIFIEWMLIDKGNIHKKIGPVSYLATEKIAFPPKPDGHTYRQTNVHTDGRTLA